MHVMLPLHKGQLSNKDRIVSQKAEGVSLLEGTNVMAHHVYYFAHVACNSYLCGGVPNQTSGTINC